MKKLLLISLGALMMASCAKDKKDYDAMGTFEATEVTVSAESTGQLENFNVSEGQVLNGGLTVGQIDARQLTLKREQLTSSNEQLAATHGQLAANKRQLAEEAGSSYPTADCEPATRASTLCRAFTGRSRRSEAS